MSASGLTHTAAQTALEAVLVNAVNVYVALLTTLPSDRSGTGLVEASGSGYARKSHSAWTSGTSGEVTHRQNNGAVTFAALTGNLSGIVGWAIYSASSGGTLYAVGQLKDSDGLPISRDFINTDQPQFASGELKLKIGSEA